MPSGPRAAAVFNTSPDLVDRVYDVVGKPLDLDEIVRAAKEAVGARPSC